MKSEKNYHLTNPTVTKQTEKDRKCIIFSSVTIVWFQAQQMERNISHENFTHN
jgi:hypothetical protein